MPKPFEIWYDCTLVPRLRFPSMRIIVVTNITEMEANNSRLDTGLLHKADQQQLLQGTIKEETCTLENCVNAELKNNLCAQNRFG